MRRRTARRRILALSAAAATLWTIGRTANWSALGHALPDSAQLSSALLELELGGRWQPAKALDGWTELVVEQTPLLSGKREAVEAWQTAAQEQADTSVPTEEPEQEPAESSAESVPAESVSVEPQPEASSASAVPAGSAEATDTVSSDTSEKAARSPQKPVGPGDIAIENNTQSIHPQVKKLWSKKPSLTLAPAEDGPQILILHTHATEAYTMADGDDYEETDPTRTTDEHYNVIRVGEEMQTVFESMGLSVIHDKTTYDYPGYSGSYARSLAGAQEYLDKYPTIQVVLDVHRDAIIDKKGKTYSKTTTLNGEETAQVMLVVGSNESGLKHPYWKRNFTLALKLQKAMLEVDRSFPRPINLRAQRFNQHLRTGSVLVEVGTSGNTLRQALAGARRFARAAGGVYLGCVKKS